MTTRTTPAYMTMLVAIAASATLVACDQGASEQTAGERVDATVAQVEQIADRIQERYSHESRYASTSLSVGLAQFIRRPRASWPEDIADLVARADKALYSGKEQGGNRVIADLSLSSPGELLPGTAP